MIITVNGETREISEKKNLASVLEELGVQQKAIAVEINGKIIKRDEYGFTEIRQGDRMEIVRFVGGG